MVSIRLHTGVGGPLTFDQAVELLRQGGLPVPRPSASWRPSAASSDATYLYYTLGKLQIMKLRADVMAQQGSASNLQTFHDSFMRQGFAPIKVIRKAMLHNDSPTL